jgi:hypothetical protein
MGHDLQSCHNTFLTLSRGDGVIATSIERTRAKRRVEELRIRGVDDAMVYNLPSSPVVPTAHLKRGWLSAAIGAAAMLAGTVFAFLSTRARA